MTIVHSLLEYIRVTAEYSNAVLLATLPYVTDFAQKIDLAIPTPVTTNHVSNFFVDPHRGWIEGAVTFTNGIVIGTQRGHVATYYSPHAFWHLQDPNDIPKFYGPLNMTEQEAVELARRYVRRLGYSLEDVCADLPPRIEMAQGIGTNIVPHILISWMTPRGDTPTRIEINANKKIAEEIRFSGIVALERPYPKVSVEPGKLPPDHPWQKRNESGKVNPQYLSKLVPHVFRAIEDWGRKLKWDIPRRVRERDVKQFYCSDQGGWPSCVVTFTNGWEFKYRHAGLTSARSPRSFFESDNLPFRTKYYAGQWKLTEMQALDVARREVAKLGYTTNFVRTDIQPRVFRPSDIKGGPTIPRLQFEWNYPDLKRREQWIIVEVDCDRGIVESINFDDVSLWKKRPPIDVPITRKQAQTNSKLN